MNDEILYLTNDVIDTLQLEESDRQDIQYLQSMCTGYTKMIRAHPTLKDKLGFPLLLPTAVAKLTAENFFKLMRIRTTLLQDVTTRNKEALWCRCAMRSTELEAQIDACREAWAAQKNFGDTDRPMSKSEMEAHIEKIENEMKRLFRKEKPRRFAKSISEPNCLNCDCPRQIEPSIAYGDEDIWRNALNVLGCQGMVLSNLVAEIARLGTELYNLRLAAPSQKKIVEEFAELAGIENIVKKTLGFFNSLFEHFLGTSPDDLKQKVMGFQADHPSASAKSNSDHISPMESATGGDSLMTPSDEDSAPPIFSSDLQPQTSPLPSAPSPQTETND